VKEKAERIRRYEKRETQYIQNKMFKEDTKKRYRNLDMKNIEAREHPLCGRSRTLLEVTVGRNSTAEWIRKEERRKISNMDCRPIKIMEITSFLSKDHN
jgi:hypothetical protein